MIEIMLGVIVCLQLAIIVWLVRILLTSKFTPEKVAETIELPKIELPKIEREQKPKEDNVVNLLDMEYDQIEEKKININEILNG